MSEQKQRLKQESMLVPFTHNIAIKSLENPPASSTL